MQSSVKTIVQPYVYQRKLIIIVDIDP